MLLDESSEEKDLYDDSSVDNSVRRSEDKSGRPSSIRIFILSVLPSNVFLFFDLGLDIFEYH